MVSGLWRKAFRENESYEKKMLEGIPPAPLVKGGNG